MKRITIPLEAVNRYLTSDITLVELADTLNIDPRTLSSRLKEYGVIVRQVKPEGLKYLCDVDYFRTIDTQDKAYWLGFIFAEGWLSYEIDKRRGSRNLRFGIEISNVDHSHLVKFKDSVKSNAKISVRTRKSIRKRVKLSCIRIGDKEFCESLLAYFKPGKKSNKIRIPSNIPNELLSHFIRGYFDGDGCVTKEGHISFTSNSKNMLMDAQNVFIKNISSYIPLHHLYKYKKCYKLIKSKLSALSIYEYLYKESTVQLQRKYARYCQIFGLAP
jgi:hypothetical protein